MAWTLRPVGRESLQTGYRAKFGLGDVVTDSAMSALLAQLYSPSYYNSAALGEPDMLRSAIESYRFVEGGEAPTPPPSPAPAAAPPSDRDPRRKPKPPLPEPPAEDEDDDDDDKQPFEPNDPVAPPAGRPPDLQRLLEPNPWDGRPDSGVKLSTAPRAYGQAVPGHPSTFGRPADTTTREDGRNELPPFPFGPDVPVEWPPHTPPVGQRGPLGDVGIDIGWGTQGGAGWAESGRRATGWSRRNMTRVPSAYKALHQVGRRPLY